jgi:hypothetical protein
LFCLGHTLGGMLRQKSMGFAADVVFASMKAVHFDFNGATASWYGMWLGFGLMVSVFLLFSAVVAWQLDRVDAAGWPAVAPIAWAFVAAYLVTAILSFAYFFSGPGIIATGVTLFLLIGARSKQARTA